MVCVEVVDSGVAGDGITHSGVNGSRFQCSW